MTAVLDLLHWRHIEAWRNNNQAVYDPSRKVFRKPPKGCIKGVPDVAGYFADGKAIFIECKKPGGKVSKEQKEFIRKAQGSGCFAMVADNVVDVDKAIMDWYSNKR